MAARGRGEHPGILTLVDVLDEHRSEARYDWRTRFGISLDDAIDGGMTWVEMWDAFLVLRRDPTSWIAAALQRWEHPTSREALILADTYDVHVSANSDPKRSKPKKYPRPWDFLARGGKRLGDASKWSQREVRALLLARGAQGRKVADGETTD